MSIIGIEAYEVIEVKKEDSDTCPYCGVKLDPWEGSSEARNEGEYKIVKVHCSYCQKFYYYKELVNVDHSL